MHAGMLCLESKGAIITETFFLGGGGGKKRSRTRYHFILYIYASVEASFIFEGWPEFP